MLQLPSLLLSSWLGVGNPYPKCEKLVERGAPKLCGDWRGTLVIPGIGSSCLPMPELRCKSVTGAWDLDEAG